MKKYNYDEESDSIYINVRKGKEDRFEEVVPGINLELDREGEILGVEILGASRFFKKKKMEAIQ